MARSRRPDRDVSASRSDTSASTSPERGGPEDDDNDSLMYQANDSQSSLAPSVSPEEDEDALRRAIEERCRVSPISRLPAELMIAIFSKLSSPGDLKNCMLVSREWARNSVGLLWHRPQTGKWASIKSVVATVRRTDSFFDYPSLVKRLNLSALVCGTAGRLCCPFANPPAAPRDQRRHLATPFQLQAGRTSDSDQLHQTYRS